MATTKLQTIREFREARGWSQAELAFRTGVSPSTVYNWEAGRFEPKASQLRKLAQALEVSMDAIDFEGNVKKRPRELARSRRARLTGWNR